MYLYSVPSHILQANQWASGAAVWLGLNELQGLGFQCVLPSLV